MRYNLYYILEGERNRLKNLPLTWVTSWVSIILKAGGEVTGIIDAREDKDEPQFED